jgi:serine/threonine protein kinase/Tfp pilus assembly protein PilF
MIGKTISHYKILEKLGEGGMGVVYKAEDTKLKRIVALKFLPLELTRDKDMKKRFIHEAQTASALDHPNVCTVFEIDETEEGQLFISMAYYKGDTVEEKTKQGPLEVDEALDITIQIAQGLDKAHKKKIVHRDIKAANIIVTPDSVAKIVDFGIAKLTGQTRVTKDGTSLGTASYMSPEQALGKEVDHRTDIWALGVLLYEMLAGEQPFKGDYEQAVIYLILNEEPEFISKVRREVPGQIEQILEKALAKNPEKRFQTMEEMLEELNIAAEELKEGQLRKWPFFKLGRKQRKYVYRAGTAVLIAIVFGIYLWQSNVASAKPVSIVLLPLESTSQETEQEWFTDGMTDALITDLAKISGLRVISLSSAMKYKGTNKTPPEIAAELGVRYIVEGSVVKVGNLVRVLARLINAPNDEYLWAEEYEREFSNILGLQGEIAQTIASQIQVKLTPQEETRLAVSRTVNPETYELYLKGMYHLNKYTPEGIEKGLAYLHEAVEKDPADAQAYAGLALGYEIIAHTPSPPPDVSKKSKAALLKALELDDTLAEAHLTLAMLNIYSDWDRVGAGQSFRRALELNPSLALAHAHYAFYLEIDGNVDEALAEMYQAQELDPLTPGYPAWQGWLYYWEGQNDKAIEEALKSLELVQDFPIGLYVLGSAYAAKGMYEEAIKAHQKAGEISPAYKWSLGHTYALAGRTDEAHEVAAELESQPNVWDTWGLAEIYTALGEKDEAFRWLEAAYEQRHPYIQWLRRDSNFIPLQDDPRFNDLAQRLNLIE